MMTEPPLPNSDSPEAQRVLLNLAAGLGHAFGLAGLPALRHHARVLRALRKAALITPAPDCKLTEAGLAAVSRIQAAQRADPGREGRLAYQAEAGQYNNPYPFGSAAYNEFERAWVQALRRAPEYPSAGAPSAAVDEEALKRLRQAQAYAKATGR